MGARVAEHRLRPSRFRRAVRFRVDLHGVSVFGPGRQHSLIRWEWVEDITAGAEVTVRSPNAEIQLPPGAFGLAPDELADRLEAARAIHRRADVIEELSRLG